MLGSVIRFAGTITANITSDVVIWASTTAVGITGRGNQTFFIRSPLATRLAVPNDDAALEERPHREAGQDELRVVVDAARRAQRTQNTSQ